MNPGPIETNDLFHDGMQPAIIGHPSALVMDVRER